MRYPVFHFKNFSYVFIPTKPITDLMQDELAEVYILCSSKTKNTYAFVGNKDCVLLTTDKVNLETKQPIPFDFELPDVHDIITFTSDDASECTMRFNKTTKSAFKTQMVNILKSIDCDDINMYFLDMNE